VASASLVPKEIVVTYHEFSILEDNILVILQDIKPYSYFRSLEYMVIHVSVLRMLEYLNISSRVKYSD